MDIVDLHDRRDDAIVQGGRGGGAACRDPIRVAAGFPPISPITSETMRPEACPRPA